MIGLGLQLGVEPTFRSVQIPRFLAAIDDEHIVPMRSILGGDFLAQYFPPRGFVGKRIAQAELAQEIVEVLFRTASVNSQPPMSWIRVRAHFGLCDRGCDAE